MYRKGVSLLGYRLLIALFLIHQIIISVLDANDNSPKFQNPASVSVREDTSTGSVVLTVKASDRDAGQNGTVVYEIVAGNEQGMSTYKCFDFC